MGSVSIPGSEFKPVTNDLNSYQNLAISADGRTLATVLTNRDTNVSLYKGTGGPLVSSAALRIAPNRLAWLDEKRMVVLTPRVALNTLDPATGAVERIDVGEPALGSSFSVCSDGHIVLPLIPKGLDHSRLYRMNLDGSAQSALTTDGVVREPMCVTDGKTVNYVGLANNSGSGWTVPLAGGTPKKLFDAEGSVGIRFSRDGHYATYQKTSATSENETFVANLRDLQTGNVRTLTPDVRFTLGAFYFTPDSKEMAYAVQQGGGEAILAQPLDGSPSHLLTDFVPSQLLDFAWSPSGDQLAVLRQHSTSDIVLITDQGGKASH